MTIYEIGHQAFLNRGKSVTTSLIHQGIQEDTILNRGLAITDPPKRITIKRLKDVRDRGRVILGLRRSVYRGFKRYAGFVLQRPLMPISPLLKSSIHCLRKCKCYGCLAHESSCHARTNPV